MMGLIWCLNKIIPNSMTMSLVDVEALILKELKGLSGGRSRWYCSSWEKWVFRFKRYVISVHKIQ